MRAKIATLLTLVMALMVSVSSVSAFADEREVRNAVAQAFEQLKSGQYDALYDGLPGASQNRISRQRFTSGLQRTRNFYELDRIEIGTVRTAGDLAVVDTVMYGRVLQPAPNEGKIVVQQYLVRENGRWKVATGDRSTVRSLLAANPTFARKYPSKNPRVFVKREGRWVDVTALLQRRRQ